MSDIKRSFKLAAKGICTIDENGRIYLSVEDEGDYDFAFLMKEFDGREVTINVTCNEEYGVGCDENTGEIFE